MPESRAAAALRDQCPHGCGRRVNQYLRESATGQKTRSTKFAPQLPDDFCRYCSRALTDAAKELEEVAARPRANGDTVGELVFKSADRGVRF